MFGKSKLLVVDTGTDLGPISVNQDALDYINRLKDRIDKTERDNGILTAKLIAMKVDLDNTPKDCKSGPWCRACEFRKCYRVYSDYIIPGCERAIELLYVCGKGNACENFVEAKKED